MPGSVIDARVRDFDFQLGSGQGSDAISQAFGGTKRSYRPVNDYSQGFAESDRRVHQVVVLVEKALS